MQIWSQVCSSRDYIFSGALIPYHAYAKKLSLCLLRMLRLGPPPNEPKNEAGIQREKDL